MLGKRTERKTPGSPRGKDGILSDLFNAKCARAGPPVRNSTTIKIVECPPTRGRCDSQSEFCISRRSRERDDIADIRNSGEEHQQALETQSKSGVGHAAITPEIDVPPVVFGIEFVKPHILLKLIEAFLALGSPDDFANSRY